LKHQSKLQSVDMWTVGDLARIILSSDGDKKSDQYIEAQIHPPISRRLFTNIIYDPSASRKIANKSVIGRSANLSRRLVLSWLESRKVDHIKFHRLTRRYQRITL